MWALAKKGKNRPGRVIVIPDCQFESSMQPSILSCMADYLVDYAPDLVMFTGDMTESASGAEFLQIATMTSRLTSAGVKWLPTMGNHDYTTLADRHTDVSSYLAVPPWVTGTYIGLGLANTYTLLTLAGRQWMVMCLEWSPRTAVVAWANSIVQAHPSVPVILMTHAYLYPDGTRFDWVAKGDFQVANPHSTFYNLVTTPAEGINDGQELWTNLVQGNSNIRVVLCGHVGIQAHRTDTRIDGSLCHQIVQDYEGEAPYGAGWMVEYMFDEDNHQLAARTFSPYLGKERTVNSNSFYLPTT